MKTEDNEREDEAPGMDKGEMNNKNQCRIIDVTFKIK